MPVNSFDIKRRWAFTYWNEDDDESDVSTDIFAWTDDDARDIDDAEDGHEELVVDEEDDALLVSVSYDDNDDDDVLKMVEDTDVLDTSGESYCEDELEWPLFVPLFLVLYPLFVLFLLRASLDEDFLRSAYA